MKQKSIGRNAIINVIKTVLSLIFPLITYPYISRVLQIEAIGKYNFSVSIVSYFSLIASLGIATYAVREGAQYRNDVKQCSQFASEIFSINLYSTTLAYILLAVCLLFVDKLNNYSGIILILSLQIILTTVGVNWIYNIFEEFSVITVMTLVFQVLAVVLMFLFVKDANDLYKYAVISVISSNGAGIFMFFYSRKYVSLHFVKNPAVYHLKPILIVFSTTIASTIYISSDTTILGWFVDDYSVGIYSTATKIYTIVKQVLNAIVAVFIPRFAFYIGKQNKTPIVDLGKKLLNCMTVICCPAMVGLFLMSKPIVEIFAGESYGEAYISLRVLSIALIFAVFANFFANCILISFKQESVVMIATIISAIVNISLNFVLIPFGEEKAAAFTTLIAEICIFIIAYIYAGRCVKISWDKKNVMSTTLGCVAIIICCRLLKKVVHSQIQYLVVGTFLSAVMYFVVQIVTKNRNITEILIKIKRSIC